MNTQLSRLKASGVLWKGHPVTSLAWTSRWRQEGESANRLSHVLAADLAPGPAGAEPSELPSPVSSQALSLHSPFDPVAQEVFLNGLKKHSLPTLQGSAQRSPLPRKLLWSPQQFLILRGLRPIHPFIPGGFPCPHSLNGASLHQPAQHHPAKLLHSTYHNLNHAAYLCVSIYFPPSYRNPRLYQGRNLTASKHVCGKLRAGDTAGNQHLNQRYPLKGESNHVHHFKFARSPTH